MDIRILAALHSLRFLSPEASVFREIAHVGQSTIGKALLRAEELPRNLLHLSLDSSFQPDGHKAIKISESILGTISEVAERLGISKEPPFKEKALFPSLESFPLSFLNEVRPISGSRSSELPMHQIDSITSRNGENFPLIIPLSQLQQISTGRKFSLPKNPFVQATRRPYEEREAKTSTTIWSSMKSLAFSKNWKR